jgi:hypothetical protein
MLSRVKLRPVIPDSVGLAVRCGLHRAALAPGFSVHASISAGQHGSEYLKY